MAVPQSIYRQEGNKLVFEFEIPREVAEFIKRHSRDVQFNDLMQKIISDGITDHVNKVLEEIEKLALVAKNPQVSIRESMKPPAIQY